MRYVVVMILDSEADSLRQCKMYFNHLVFMLSSVR